MPLPQVQVQHLRSFGALRDALEALEAQVGAELVELPDSDPFCTLTWFENLALYGLETSNGQLEGLELLLASDLASGQSTCLALRTSPTELKSLSNYYTGLFGLMQWRTRQSSNPVTNNNAVQFHSEAMEPALLQLQVSGATRPVLRISPLDGESSFAELLEAALEKSGYWVDRHFCFGNWYLRVGGRSAQDYFKTLPSSLANSIERGQRRLAHAPWNLHIQQLPDAKLEQSIAHFVSIYNQSWKPKEPNPEFIPHLIRAAADQGWLRLGLLEINGQPIASQFWLVKNGKAYIFKLAFVKGQERFSPGSILTWRMMRQVIDLDKVDEVDFLSGDDAYKKDWMPDRRERIGYAAFNKRQPLGWYRALRHFGKRLLSKPAAKRT